LGDECIQGAESFFHRRDRVVGVDLIEVDVVGLQAAEASFDGVHDMPARRAHIVTAGADSSEDFGGDDDVFARDLQILERLTKHRFALAFRVDIRSIEEVDAGLKAGFDEFVGSRLIDGANGFPVALAAAKSHGAEAQGGNEKASIA